MLLIEIESMSFQPRGGAVHNLGCGPFGHLLTAWMPIFLIYTNDMNILWGQWHVPCLVVGIMNNLQNLYSIHQLQIIY